MILNYLPCFSPISAITYKYDKLGQRIRVNDPFDTKAGEDGTTWQYVYDLGGNILSKTHYVYTTGIVGAAIDTDAYAYGDANWKDKLTAYNSEPITYDEIGNPLTYDGWTYTWEKGRQLKRMEHRIPGGEDAEGNPLPGVVDRTLEFAYDAAGLRTQKKHTYTDAQGQAVVETTDYILHEKLLTHQRTTTTVDGVQQGEPYQLHFYYDAARRPIMVRADNEEAQSAYYSYIHSLRMHMKPLLRRN